MMNRKVLGVKLCLLFFAKQALAASPKELLHEYETVARQEGKGFTGFSSARGRELYFRNERTSKGDMSCSSCHTADPRQVGRTRANKDIDPLAPAVNAKRFTNRNHVEKWFTRNCDDVLQRPCTVQEKGDFISFLLSIQ